MSFTAGSRALGSPSWPMCNTVTSPIGCRCTLPLGSKTRPLQVTGSSGGALQVWGGGMPAGCRDPEMIIGGTWTPRQDLRAGHPPRALLSRGPASTVPPTKLSQAGATSDRAGRTLLWASDEAWRWEGLGLPEMGWGSGWMALAKPGLPGLSRLSLKVVVTLSLGTLRPSPTLVGVYCLAAVTGTASLVSGYRRENRCDPASCLLGLWGRREREREKVNCR